MYFTTKKTNLTYTCFDSVLEIFLQLKQFSWGMSRGYVNKLKRRRDTKGSVCHAS